MKLRLKFFLTTMLLLLVGGSVLIVPASSTTGLRKSVGIKKYGAPISSVENAWLSLDAIPQKNEQSNIRSHLKQALIALYEAEHKAATATWITGLNDMELSKAIERRKTSGDTPVNYQLVSITPEGAFFITNGFCTGFGVCPASPNYSAVKSLVGSIEPGYLKEITPIPERILDAEKQWQSSLKSTSKPTPN